MNWCDSHFYLIFGACRGRFEQVRFKPDSAMRDLVGEIGAGFFTNPAPVNVTGTGSDYTTFNHILNDNQAIVGRLT